MPQELLKRVSIEQLPSLGRDTLDAKTVATAAEIIADVQAGGSEALRGLAIRFGDIQPDAPLVLGRDAMQAAFDSLPHESQAVLTRTAERIRRFAEAQKQSLSEMTFAIPGGEAGQRILPLKRAACYAPGGRYPLPSSVLMTAIPARVAGVSEVWVASPKPSVETLAAAFVAQADYLLAVGGAQAIAALAYGCDTIPVCDVIVGPGNRFVTAAKKLVAGHCRIDMLAGPSELVVLADASADPKLVAADLLAQAEHDPDAVPVLVALDESLIARVDTELATQLDVLPTADIARLAVENGFAVLAHNLDEAAEICNRLAPEHLELDLADPDALIPELSAYGALFVGAMSAEVLGDYGAGPNHVLPTGGTARFDGGLSVFTFLSVRTWLRIDDANGAAQLIGDAAALADMEGLAGHAHAARLRKS